MLIKDLCPTHSSYNGRALPRQSINRFYWASLMDLFILHIIIITWQVEINLKFRILSATMPCLESDALASHVETFYMWRYINPAPLCLSHLWKWRSTPFDLLSKTETCPHLVYTEGKFLSLWDSCSLVFSHRDNKSPSKTNIYSYNHFLSLETSQKRLGFTGWEIAQIKKIHIGSNMMVLLLQISKHFVQNSPGLANMLSWVSLTGLGAGVGGWVGGWNFLIMVLVSWQSLLGDLWVLLFLSESTFPFWMLFFPFSKTSTNSY